MDEKFTQNLMMKILYGEANIEEEMFLNEEMKKDWTLREEFEFYREIIGKLGSEKRSPHRSSISIIKAHSRKKSPAMAV